MESRGHNEQNKQSTHTHTETSLNDRGENKSYKFTGNEKDAHSTTSLHMYSLNTAPGLAFVLHGNVNLNKERNKWARCLRVDALATQRTPATSRRRAQGRHRDH